MTNTGYQQAIIAKKISRPGGLPLDVDGNICIESGKKQAILLLNGEDNPDPNQYEVEGFFNAGDKIEGQDTRRYNTDACPLPVSGYISVSPDFIEITNDAPQHRISVDSSHHWRIASDIPDDLMIDVTNGNTGTSVISVSKSATATSKDVSLVFENTLTGNTDVLNIALAIDAPAVYPDVWSEHIIDDIEESVCRIGEQVWSRKVINYNPAGAIAGYLSQEHLNTWKANYPWANIDTTSGEYQAMFGSRFYSLAPLVNVINEMVSAQGNDIHKHMPPASQDVKELLGFTLCDVWDGVAPVNSDLSALTYGVLAIKGQLTGEEGDDRRFSYPENWSRDILIAGSDKYGLALTGCGEFHRTDTGNVDSLKRLFIGGVHPLRDISPQQPYSVNVMLYRQTDVADMDNMRLGVKIEPYMVTGGLCKGIRTMRYLEMDYDIYSDGNEIRKINTGDAIPEGFTPVPKGALRGAYFAHPEYSLAQLQQIAGFVEIPHNNEFALG